MTSFVDFMQYLKKYAAKMANTPYMREEQALRLETVAAFNAYTADPTPEKGQTLLACGEAYDDLVLRFEAVVTL